MVSTISPENLLDLHHFYMNTITKKTENNNNSTPTGKQETPKDSPAGSLANGFEMKSRKAWTDLLLQVAKVFLESVGFFLVLKYKSFLANFPSGTQDFECTLF